MIALCIAVFDGNAVIARNRKFKKPERSCLISEALQRDSSHTHKVLLHTTVTERTHFPELI